MSRHYLYLWTGIVIGIGGQALLKAGASAPDFASQIFSLTTVAGLACYGAATLMYMMAIRVIPIAVAFPSISMSYVVVLLVGATLFGEHLSAAKVAGVVMIGAGVWVLNRSSPIVAVDVDKPAFQVEQPVIPAEFDRHAASYDGGMDGPIKRMLGSADHFMEVKAEWLLRREPALRQSGTHLLDYGCGAGDLMRKLAELGATAQFTGCDVSSGMLAEARRRWPGTLGDVPRLAQQDGASTGFADGTFEVAVVSAVLHHVTPANRPTVYEELARVLKPGGRLYVFEHNPRNPLVRYVVSRTKIDENAILLDPSEVRDSLPAALRHGLDTQFLMFMPPRLSLLRIVDRMLTWLPLGAQYAVTASKTA